MNTPKAAYQKSEEGGDAEGIDRCADFERAIQDAANTKQRYVLRLYVTGNTPRSTRAIRNIRAFCEEHLHGQYDLEVIDIHQQPVLARGEQIIAAPTLIKKLPSPLRKLLEIFPTPTAFWWEWICNQLFEEFQGRTDGSHYTQTPHSCRA